MGMDVSELYKDMEKAKVLRNSTGSNFDDQDIEAFITSEEIFKEDQPDNLPIVRGGREKDDEESFVYKRYTNRREHKYTEQEMTAIREGCVVTYVNDYVSGDFYHMSDEERAKYDSLAEISARLGAVKSVYRRVDQYVIAMRTIYHAWGILAKSNLLYPRDEFFKLVGKGKITSSKIIMPVLKNASRYNMEKILLYIGDKELNPADLLPIKSDDVFDTYYDDDEKEAELSRLFSEEELEEIAKFDEAALPENKMKTIKLDKKFIDAVDYYSSKKRKKMSKADRKFFENMAPIIKAIKSKSAKNTGFYSSTVDDLGEEDHTETIFDNLKFHGSWESDLDVMLYDIAVEDALNDVPIPGDRHLTNNDLLNKEFFATLSRNNVNDVKLKRFMEQYNGSDIHVRRKEIVKENRAREEKFIQRVTNLQSNPKFAKLIKKAKKSIDMKKYSE